MHDLLFDEFSCNHFSFFSFNLNEINPSVQISGFNAELGAGF